MKHLELTLATYVYNHCNMCNITIYFYNIHMEHLQHTSQISEIIETYSCNICFECNISLLLGRMEARRCVVFTGGSGLAVLVGGGPAAVAACRGMEASAARLGEGSSTPRLVGPVAERHAWQGQRPSGAPRRRPRAALRRASGHALGDGGLADKSDRKRNKWT